MLIIQLYIPPFNGATFQLTARWFGRLSSSGASVCIPKLIVSLSVNYQPI